MFLAKVCTLLNQPQQCTFKCFTAQNSAQECWWKSICLMSRIIPRQWSSKWDSEKLKLKWRHPLNEPRMRVVFAHFSTIWQGLNAKSDIVGHEVSLFPCEMMAAIWTRIKMEWSTINNCITIYDVLYGCELYNFSNDASAKLLFYSDGVDS